VKRPANLVYGLEDSPPPLVTALNGVQYVGLIAINLLYPLVVFRVAETPVQLIGNLLAIGMLVLGVATFLQARRNGPVGSGYMCPATFTAAYLGPSLLAVQIGGLPLLFGMTLFAGLLEVVLAPLLNRLRPIFPPEVSGLVIFVIGLSGGIAGLRAMLGEKAAPVSVEEWWIAGATLAAMIALNVWGNGAHALRADRAGDRLRCRWFRGIAGSRQRPHHRRGALGRPARFRPSVMVIRSFDGGAVRDRSGCVRDEGGWHDRRMPAHERRRLGAA
jgi:xanthine/uracil permease